MLGDNEARDIIDEGTVLIKTYVDGLWKDSRIENVLLVPKLKKNLFSVGVCTKKDCTVIFRGNVAQVKLENEVVANGLKQENGVCRMLFKVVKTGSVEEMSYAATNLNVWHERLGRMGERSTNELVKKGLVTGVKVSKNKKIFCEPCQVGKSHRQPFNVNSKKVTTEPGEKFHADVCGPMPEDSLGGSRYFLTFIDDASGYRTVYFMKNKSEVLENLKIFERSVAHKFGRPLKKLRTDNRREYVNGEVKNYLESRRIIHEATAPYTPQQNRKLERENRTIVESARTMLHAKSLPVKFWAEAVNCAVYVLNRTVWAQGKVTPYEKWIGKPPSLKHLRIFGSPAYANIPKQFVKKFDARAKKMIFIGYQQNSPNYRVYNPATGKISSTRDVVFDEKIGSVAATEADEDDDVEVIIPWKTCDAEDRKEPEEREEEEDEVFEAAQEEAPPPHQANPNDAPRELRDRTTIRRPSRYEVDYVEYVIPINLKEASNSNEAAQWAEAGREELAAHEKNRTWTIVPKTASMKTIDSKWVFRVKTDETGKTHRFKAMCKRISTTRRRRLQRNIRTGDSLRLLESISGGHDEGGPRTQAVRC